MTLQFRAVLALLAILAAVAGWWRLTAHFENKGYTRAQAEARALADEQTARIRDLQRAAELRYVVQAGVRDRFITRTVTEVRHAAAPLASCPVPTGVVGLLNDAAACAGSDSAATCGADKPVPGAAATR